MHETDSTQANEPCKEVDLEDRPAAVTPTRQTTSAQVAQKPKEDGLMGQADEYETEVDGTGLDSDELALIGVQSRRTSRSGRTLRAAVRQDL